MLWVSDENGSWRGKWFHSKETNHLLLYIIHAEKLTPWVLSFFHSTIQYDDNINPLDKIINLVTNRPEDARKYHAYKPVLNPSPGVHNIYSDDIYIHIIPGHTYGVTRVRLMSHDWKIETCSWSRILRDLWVSVWRADHTGLAPHIDGCELTKQTRQKYDKVNRQNSDVLLMKQTT